MCEFPPTSKPELWYKVGFGIGAVRIESRACSNHSIRPSFWKVRKKTKKTTTHKKTQKVYHTGKEQDK